MSHRSEEYTPDPETQAARWKKYLEDRERFAKLQQELKNISLAEFTTDELPSLYRILTSSWDVQNNPHVQNDMQLLEAKIKQYDMQLLEAKIKQLKKRKK
jgi:hypothetical protein